MMTTRRSLCGLALGIWAACVCAVSTAHEVSPPLLIFAEVGEVLTLTVSDCCTCQANIQASSNDTNVVVVSPDAGAGITVDFEVTATGVGETTITVEWQGFGTDENGFPCEDIAGATVEVIVLPADDSSGNTTDATTVSDPVNSFTGEFFLDEEPDVELGGPIPIRFQRYYGSHLYRENFGNEALGQGWLHNYDFRMVRGFDPEKYVLVVTNRGRFLRFEKNASNWVLLDNADVPWQLLPDGNDLQLADPIERLVYRFNTAGALVEIFDLNGNAVSLTYSSVSDGVGSVSRLTGVSDGLGRSLVLAYDGAAKLASVSDGVRSRTYTVTSGRLASYSDADSKTTTYSYDLSKPAYGALLTEKALPLGNIPFTNTYDSSGRVLTQADAGANVWSFAYSPGTTFVTDPASRVYVHDYDADGQTTNTAGDDPRPVAYTYDSAGRIASITGTGPGVAGLSYAFEYHAPSGNLSRIVYPDSTETTFTYAARTALGVSLYYLTQIDHPDGTTDVITYDAAGNIASQTDRLGRTWTFTRDAQGNVTAVELPTAGIFTYTYNADGTLATMEDPAENVTTFAYDGFKRLISIEHPDATTIEYAYDARDHVVTFTNESTGTHTMTYNDNGSLATSTDGSANTTTYTYDDADRLISVTAPNGAVSSRTHDELGRLDSMTDRNGNTFSVGFDSTSGLVTSRTDGEGNTWTRTFDENGYIESMTDALGQTTQYETNYLGQTTRAQSPRGAVWQLNHDVFDRLDEVIDPLGQVWDFDYDAAWRMAGIDVSGHPVDVIYNYGALDGIESTVDGRGQSWHGVFDNQGRLVSATDPLSRTTTYGYNNRNRISTVTYPASLGTQTITYTPTGAVASRTYSDATNLTYTYDAEGSLIASNSLTLSVNSEGEISESNGLVIGRDPGGRVTSVTYDTGKTVTYTYDGRDLPVTVTDWVGGVTTLEYDDMGRMTTITRPTGGTTEYLYDIDGAIVGIRDRTSSNALLNQIDLTRNLRGQITGATRNSPLSPVPEDVWMNHAYNAASEVNDFTYDALGRLIEDDRRTYTWDLAGRLTSHDDGTTTVTYGYDGAGKMVSRAQGGATRSYVWNYGFPIPVAAIAKDEGIDTAYYVYTPYGQLLHRINASDNARRYYHFDEAGNTLFLTNQAQAITDAYATTPYGEVIARTGATDNPFVHMGQQGVMRDGETDLYYMRARFYDAETARFLSRDPFNRSVSPLETNPYSYARGNPLLFNDPLGYNARVIFDGGIHTDIAVDIWCGDQIIGTLKLGFFATGFIHNKLNWNDWIQAASTIKGQMTYGPGLGPHGRNGNNITIDGTKAQDERLARQLLEWIGMGGAGGGISPGEVIKSAFPLPKGQTSGNFPIKVNSTSSYGAYRTIFGSQVCNDFTDDALDVYFGRDWYSWALPAGHFGQELFDAIVRQEHLRHSTHTNWLSYPQNEGK